MKPTKPNLFIIGAAKSGTTSLHHHLAGHDDVFMSDPKEPGFFTPDVGYYPNSRDWYLGLFEGAAGYRYRGESSTHYSKLPVFTGVAARIAEFVDEEPRFIYLMRDPLDRAISHYWHNVRKLEEHRGIMDALRHRVDYLAFSDYRKQLEPYVDRFGRESVLALSFETLAEKPEVALPLILSWLDLDPGIAPEQLEKRNARPEEFRRVRGRGILDRIAHSAIWNHLSPVTPKWVRNVGQRLAYGNSRFDVAETERAVEHFRPQMQEQMADLETYLGEHFPEWRLTRGVGAGAA